LLKDTDDFIGVGGINILKSFAGVRFYPFAINEVFIRFRLCHICLLNLYSAIYLHQISPCQYVKYFTKSAKRGNIVFKGRKSNSLGNFGKDFAFVGQGLRGNQRQHY
jgi:hypothetical protein